MEPPIDFTADSVRNEKVKVLKSMHTPGPKSVVRGQYGAGFVEGIEVPAYREEDGVAPGSLTETYIAAKLYVDNWRWADTPFYVRAGKRLARRETTIAIQFQRAPHPPFEAIAGDGLRPNVLLIHVQPDEGVSLAIGAKVPGAGMTIRTVHMDFLYGGAFRTGLPEAYERLILDAMLGDATLFTREDEVEEQWKLVDAILGGWQRDRPSFPNYESGTWGPQAADDLIHRDAAPGVATRALMGVVSDIERQLGRLRAREAADGMPELRTSTMTHIVWCPPEWRAKARATLAGLLERHPARTIFLIPEPGGEAGIEARVELKDFQLQGMSREVLSEVIELRLRGSAARHPGSIVLPLLVSDLPVFCRWRGEPAWESDELAEIVGVADRLVVDSSEWRGVPAAYARLAALFDRVAVSDIAFSRTLPWRRRLAELWPEIGDDREAAGRRAAGGRRARRRLAAVAAGARRGADPARRRGGRRRSGSTASRSPRRASR